MCVMHRKEQEECLTHAGLKKQLEEKQKCVFSKVTVNRNKNILFTKHF